MNESLCTLLLPVVGLSSALRVVVVSSSVRIRFSGDVLKHDAREREEEKVLNC